MKQDIVVFDVLGPVYQYAEAEGRIEDCVPIIEKKIMELLPEKWESTEDKYALGSEMEAKFIQDGIIHPIATPCAIETLVYLREKGVMPVVVSGGKEYTLQEALDKVIEEYVGKNGMKIEPGDLIPHKNRISTLPIGGKGDPKTWQTAVFDNFGTDNRIVLGYEDNAKYAVALAEGLNCPGLHVVSDSYDGTKSLVGHLSATVLSYNPTIIRGTMEQHYEILKKWNPWQNDVIK